MDPLSRNETGQPMPHAQQASSRRRIYREIHLNKPHHGTRAGCQLFHPQSIESGFFQFIFQSKRGPSPEVVWTSVFVPCPMSREKKFSARLKKSETFGQVYFCITNVFEYL